MEKNLVVLKVYPKINGQFIASFNSLGFQLSESKNKGIYYKANKDMSIYDMNEKMEDFLDFVKTFGLKVTFDLSKTITYSEKEEDISPDELGELLLKEIW